MGGAAPAPSGKGGKKALDAAINLVPFIDLLSCCLSFLLITAVWTALARMDVQQKGPGAAGAESDKPPEATVNLTLFVDKDGYIFSKSTGESTSIPMKGDDYDYGKLAEVLLKAKGEVGPDKRDIAIKADDAVIYDKIMHTIDTTITCGRAKGEENQCFPDVALSDKGAGG